MPDIPFNKRLTMFGLEREIRNTEAVGYEAKAIAVKDAATIVSFDDGTVADSSFVLWVDPTGAAVGPGGSEALFRGKALVQGFPAGVAVAAFRKA
ncbi:hypothetical protein GGQ80_000766 [Sphingomonas jinjuensis]|uniref:Uncharacterized protein n=1 Tax=Sphingomonas jinjuensis TaxID=535907 RepID=A0A840FFV3_9SPHN|nr:hypothetical protein [Sphingomonas jinjuensis]MBB4152878.1 hypothetical protein [Sphingomonas jinjuensis]